MKAKILVITPTLGNRESLSKTIESVKNIGGDLVKHIIVAPNSHIPNIKNKYGNKNIKNTHSFPHFLDFGYAHNQKHCHHKKHHIWN